MGDTPIREHGLYVTRNEFSTFSDSVSSSFAQVNRGLEGLADKIDHIGSKGIDWKAVLAAFSLFATIVIAIGSIVAWGLNSRLSTIDDVLSNHMATGGHSEMSSRMAAMEATTAKYSEKIISLDEVLQREMRLLDDSIHTEMRLTAENAQSLSSERHQNLGEKIDRNAEVVAEIITRLRKQFEQAAPSSP